MVDLYFVRESDNVSDQPEVDMSDWSIHEVNHGDVRTTLHFVGRAIGIARLRVTTPVVEFDWQKKEGRTQSGRKYRLIGPPSETEDELLYVWRIRGMNLVDVTQQLLKSN